MVEKNMKKKVYIDLYIIELLCYIAEISTVL